jgi:hypothetical protein
MPEAAAVVTEGNESPSYADKDAFEIFNSMPQRQTGPSDVDIVYTPTKPAAQPAAEEEKEEETIQTTIFRDDEIEKVEVVKKPKKNRDSLKPLRVVWTKIESMAAGLYDNVNQEINE